MENRKYAQITQVMAACIATTPAQEWEQMVQQKAQQHLEGNSSCSSKNWEMGKWREIPVQTEPKKSPFLEIFGANMEQQLEDKEMETSEGEEVEESQMERKEQKEARKQAWRKGVSKQTKKPLESRIKGDEEQQHLPVTQKSGITKKNGQPPAPRPKGVLPQGEGEPGNWKMGSSP